MSSAVYTLRPLSPTFCTVLLSGGFHFQIPIVPLKVLDIYRVYSRKLDQNISLLPPNYCNMLQADVVAIYQAAQWMLTNDGFSFIARSFLIVSSR